MKALFGNMDRRRKGWFSLGLIGIALYLIFPVRLGIAVGASMEPTFHNGQFYLVDQAHYRRHPLRAGDVVLFQNEGVTCIKRVLATAGEEVLVVRTKGVAPDEVVRVWQRRRLLKVSHSRYWKNSLRVVPLIVPPGTCYVIGDHAEASMDSRSFGVVDLSSIEGKVLFAPPGELAQDAAGPPVQETGRQRENSG